MVCSMTGFGRSEYLDDEKKIIIEIKSVNHRYCDINVKLPRTISRFEPEIRKRLKLYAERGKIQPGAERCYGTFHGIIENGEAIMHLFGGEHAEEKETYKRTEP